MILVYGLLGFVVIYLLYRLVQFWQMWEQLKSEGRDIYKEMKDGS